MLKQLLIAHAAQFVQRRNLELRQPDGRSKSKQATTAWWKGYLAIEFIGGDQIRFFVHVKQITKELQHAAKCLQNQRL